MPVIGGLNLDLALKLLYTKTPDDILEFYQMPYPLTDQQIEKYQQDGFVYLPEMVSQKSISYLQRVIKAAILVRKHQNTREALARSGFFKELRRHHNR